MSEAQAVIEDRFQYRDTSFVLVYDPKDLAEIDLNVLRRDTPFENIQYVRGEVPTLLLESEANQTRATIQYTRLEFVQAVTIPFRDRSLDIFGNLLRALPELSVKAFGLNYTLMCTTEQFESAGQFIRERFLAPQKALEVELAGEFFAASARMLFGQASQYRDIRLTPEVLSTRNLVAQYHYHGEESVRDRDRILRLLTERYATELAHVTAVTDMILK